MSEPIIALLKRHGFHRDAVDFAPNGCAEPFPLLSREGCNRAAIAYRAIVGNPLTTVYRLEAPNYISRDADGMGTERTEDIGAVRRLLLRVMGGPTT